MRPCPWPRAFPWRLLETAGARLAFGSDWPIVPPDVLRGVYCAVTRKTPEGKPEGGWIPELAVSLESALRHYTIDAACASFEEGEKGSITTGKLADLVGSRTTCSGSLPRLSFGRGSC